MLRVCLLGDLVVEHDGVAVALPERRASRSLLAWLVAHPGMHARSTLAARFWPDVLDSSARSSLRTALADLRRALGAAATEVLVASRNQVGVLSGQGVCVVLWEFERLVDEGRLDEALPLCRGELLADLDQDWVLEARDEHRRRVGAVLERLAQRAEASRTWEDAVRWSRERAAQDPLSEDVQRALMRRLALAGDRPAALLAYRRLAERLAQELGVAPSRETRELVAAIRQGSLEASDDEGSPPPPSLVAGDRGPFVGRAEHLDRLEEIFGATAGHSPRLALLTGEPGIGKTRLARELALRVAAGGATVLYGRCDEDGLVPYQPFVEALTHYLGAAGGGAVEGQLERFSGELQRLLPQLPALPGAGGQDPQSERYRLFEAVSGLLLDIARTAPTLVVLDDLHWADGATLALLRHLLRTTEVAPLLVVGTYRATEMGRHQPLARTLADLRRDVVPERLVLSGLAQDDVTALVESAAQRRISDALSRAIWQHTEGNPFFVGEVVRNLVASGALDADDAGGAGSALRLLGVPEGVREVIGRRLAALPEPLGQLLALAAVIGRDFDSAVLEALSGTPADALAEQLEVAVAAHVVEEQPERFGGFRFAHALIRETLYQEMTVSRRVRLHRRVGEILEGLHEAGSETSPAEPAHHFLAAAPAGDVAKAVTWATRAAEQASRQFAHEEAAEHYERALQALELDSRRDERRRCELLLALGAAHWRAGAFDASRTAFRAAAELAEALGASESLARAALGFGGEYVSFDVGVSDEELVDLLERALGRVTEEHPALRARLMARLAEALTFSGDQVRKQALAEQAAELVRRAGDQAALVEVLLRAQWACWGSCSLEEKLHIAREAIRVAEAAGDSWWAIQGHDHLIEILLEAGDLPAARAEIRAFTATAEELRQPYPRWLASAFAAMLALLEGRLQEADRLVHETLALGQEAQNRNALLLYGAQLLVLRREQGRLDELSEVVERFAEEHAALPGWRCALAWLHAELGREGDARRELERVARRDFAELPRDAFWLPSLSLLSEVVAAVGDRRRASVLYDLLAPYAARWVLLVPAGVSVGPVSRFLGILAGTLSRFDSASEHFDAAMQAHAGTGAVLGRVRTGFDHSRTLLLRDRPGDRERAQTTLAETLRTAEALGMSALARQTQALAAAAGLELSAQRPITAG